VLIVPAPPDPGWAKSQAPTLAQARALCDAGAEQVDLVIAGGRREQHLLGPVRVHLEPLLPGPLPRLGLVARAVQLRPHLVHFYHWLDLRTLGMLAATPLVIHAEYNGGGVPLGPRSHLSRGVSRRLSALWVTARDQAEAFVRGGALSRSTRIETAPETSSVLPVLPRRPGPGPRVLVVARAAPDKRPEVALRAFERIRAVHPAATLTWAALSAGPRHSWLAESVRAAGGELWLGIGSEQMAERYSSADLLLHPSAREVCGYAFIEGMQAGLRIAASDIPPFRALAGADGAALAPVGDDQALAEGALRLWADPEAGLRARRRYEYALSFEAIGRRKLAGYRGERLSDY
jgi:glycosyltransferase involved in cell wall biosynthesis